MILVMGASGNIGRALVQELKARGAQFRAGYRTLEQIAAAEQEGIEPVGLDYNQPDTLRAALQGVDKVFFVSPPSLELGVWESNIVESAQQAGVKHLVKSSVWGADQGTFIFAQPHHVIQEKIRATGLPYTFLQPNGFMQNMLGSAPQIKAQGTFALPATEARVSEVDVRDIGRVAATVLTTPGHEGKAYPLSGPEALTNAERATILSEVLGKPITFTSTPDAAWKAAVLGMGLPEWQVDGIIDLQHYYATGQAAAIAPAVTAITGQPPISFRQFVQDHAAAFA